MTIDEIAAHLGLSGSTLVFIIVCINQGAKALGRRIPNDATGFWGNVRMGCVILGADPSSVLNSRGDTIAVVAAQAATTPPIDAKVAEAADHPFPDPQEQPK